MNVVGSRARRGHAGAAVCSALSGLGGDNCLCCANSYDGDGREMLSFRTRSIAVTVTPPPRWRSGPGAGVRSGVGETDTNVDWQHLLAGQKSPLAQPRRRAQPRGACATPHPYPSLSLARRSTNAYCAQRCPQHEFPTRLAVPKSCPKSGHTAA